MQVVERLASPENKGSSRVSEISGFRILTLAPASHDLHYADSTVYPCTRIQRDRWIGSMEIIRL